MPYASQNDLVARFGETEIILLSDDANTGSIGSDIVIQVLADVDAIIDGYLAPRYTLPLLSIPAALVPIACDLARYRLATRTGTSRPTEVMQERNAAAERWLRDVATGKFGLGLLADNTQLPSAGAQSASSRRVFTDRNLRDFTEPPEGYPGYPAGCYPYRSRYRCSE